MKPSDVASPICRLDALESSLLIILQEVRSVKTQLGQQATCSDVLEPLLEAEQVAKLLGVDCGYVYSQAAAANATINREMAALKRMFNLGLAGGEDPSKTVYSESDREQCTQRFFRVCGICESS